MTIANEFNVENHPHSKSEIARLGLHDALEHEDPITALRSLEEIDKNDIIWRLAGENDICSTFGDHLPDAALAELQASIKADSLTLAATRLPADELSSLGLDPRHFDDAGIHHPPELRDVFLLAQSWDNTDHDPLVGELLVRAVGHLTSKDTRIEHAIAQALENDTSFKEAFAAMSSREDARLDVDLINAYQRVQAR